MISANRQTGVTLIEVLIAIVIMAIGLIGIAAMQTAAISNNVVSGQYTQAATIAQNLAERMRANRDGVVNNSYLHAAGAVGNPTLNCAITVCSSANQAEWDLAVWYVSAAPGVTLPNVPNVSSANLPSAVVAVTCGTSCTVDSVRMITVYWDGDNNGATGFGCNPNLSTDLRCFRLPFVP